MDDIHVLNLKEIFEKEYVKGYFHRNKKIFIVSILIFIMFNAAEIPLPETSAISAQMKALTLKHRAQLFLSVSKLCYMV